MHIYSSSSSVRWFFHFILLILFFMIPTWHTQTITYSSQMFTLLMAILAENPVHVKRAEATAWKFAMKISSPTCFSFFFILHNQFIFYISNFILQKSRISFHATMCWDMENKALEHPICIEKVKTQLNSPNKYQFNTYTGENKVGGKAECGKKKIWKCHEFMKFILAERHSRIAYNYNKYTWSRSNLNKLQPRKKEKGSKTLHGWFLWGNERL